MVSQLLLGAALTLAAAVVLILATFALAVRRGRYDLIDSVWGLGFALIAVVTFALSRGDLLPSVLVTALTVAWGLRLSVHIHTRNRHRDEDPRYADIARRAGPRPRRYLLTRVYLLQAALMWWISLPVQAAQYGQDSPQWPMWLGVAVWAVGVTFESVGDHQLRVFRADPTNAHRVLDTGLWRYTRHPNYFGDACVWWGLYLIACHTWLGVATVLSPVTMTALLAAGTGKPLLEKGMADRRPGYTDYVNRTSGFIPRPPRRPRPTTTDQQEAR